MMSTSLSPRAGRCTGDPQGYYTKPWLNFKGEKEGMADSWSELVLLQISPSQSD